MGRRRAAIALLALGLIATGCTGGGDKKASGGSVEEDVERAVVGPQTYTIGIDASSPPGQSFQSAVYTPINVAVRPGDTVVFENLSTQASHTVTFGIKEAMTPEAPSPVTKAGTANPIVFQPCYTAEVPGAGAETCPQPAPASPPPYAGEGFWNSGLIAPAGASRSISMTIAPDAGPDTYSYVCLLHGNMSGLIEVVPEDDLRKTPQAVVEQGTRQRSAVLNAAARITAPAWPATGPAVMTGWGDATTAVNLFSPASIDVKAGQTVTWKGFSPYEPHTVTFESPFKSPEDPGVFTPGGARAGARYSGGFAHSGLIGPQPFPAETFSLVFTKPGTYSYSCVLHPGMAGQVVVTN